MTLDDLIERLTELRTVGSARTAPVVLEHAEDEYDIGSVSYEQGIVVITAEEPSA